MMQGLIHGLATMLDVVCQQPGPLQETMKGVPEKLRELYGMEKIEAMAKAAIEQADTDKDGRISLAYVFCVGQSIDG